MEILISIVVSTLAEVIKKVASKFGVELTKKIVAGLVFLGCVIGAYLFDKQILTMEMLKSVVELFLIAVGYYEVVYKRILMPVFNAVVSKLKVSKK